MFSAGTPEEKLYHLSIHVAFIIIMLHDYLFRNVTANNNDVLMGIVGTVSHAVWCLLKIMDMIMISHVENYIKAQNELQKNILSSKNSVYLNFYFYKMDYLIRAAISPAF